MTLGVLLDVPLRAPTAPSQFCREAGFPESRFYHWQARLRQEVAAGQTGEFMPVSINNRGGKVVPVEAISGLVIYHLKLERGYIHIPARAEWEGKTEGQTDWTDLVMMVEGIYPDTCKMSGSTSKEQVLIQELISLHQKKQTPAESRKCLTIRSLDDWT